MREPRGAPVTPGSVKRAAVELRAGELLAVSKERDVEGKGGGVGEECRGEEEDWRCRRATGIWVEAAQASSQLFVEAHSSKGQASLLRNRLHPAILARSPGAFFTARHVLSQKSLHRNLNALRSVNLDHRIAEAS